MKKTRFDSLLWALNLAQTLATPVLFLKKWRRFQSRGDNHEWDFARWKCDFSCKNEKKGPHLVFVAMGFAETRLAARLTELLQEKRPDVRITWSIRNLEAARMGKAVPPNQAVAPFPFDYFWPASQWKKNVAPDAVVFIERFAFVNLARILHGSGVRVAAVAARTRGGKHGWRQRFLLEAFDLLCLRSAEEKKKLGEVPPSLQVRVTGSLKFWPQLPEIAPERARTLEKWLSLAQNRPVVAAGSTQPGDEPWIFEAFAPLREEFGAVLLLAPRHVTRADEVEQLARSRGWKVARRSREHTAKSEKIDVLLLDTMGELTHAYGAAQAAFVGGTISGTGHNVLEPIAHGIPVFFGPKRGTFAAEQELCEAAGAGFRVFTPQELSQHWHRAIFDQKWHTEVSHKARQLNEQGIGAWQNTVKALLELCDGITKNQGDAP